MPKPKKPPVERFRPDTLDQVLLLLVGGNSADAVANVLVRELHLKPPTAAAYVREARRRITLATSANRDEEFGKAVARYEKCYADAVQFNDVKSALAATNALCRLRALNEPARAIPLQLDARTDENLEAKAIRDHLVPLQLAPETAPLTEHCRLAALKLITHRDAE